MILAYIVIPGAVAATTALLALLLGAPMIVVLGSYCVTGFGTAVVCILLAGLRDYQDNADIESQNQIELELIALQESIRRDHRLRAGSPDCLAPVLYRSLLRQEGHIRRHSENAKERSEYVLQVAR